jgi:hypothetical protein
MPSQRRLLFDSSVAALVLVGTPRGAARQPMALTLGPAGRLLAPSPTGVSIEFAPEPDPTTNLMDLSGDQATGPLPLGFEFELFGVRYTWFDLSSDGFMTFGTDRFPSCSDSDPKGCFIPLSSDLRNFIALGWTDACPFARSKVRYEVRGAPGRRRLVLSFAGVPAADNGRLGAMIAQLVLHERTGMIDVHTVRQDPVSHRLRQEAVRFTTARW